jgi:hypothetical protein
MMVPLYFDVARKVNVVLAVVGWAPRDLQVSFRTPPKVTVSGPSPLPAVLFETAECSIPVPVAVETPVRRLLDRDATRSGRSARRNRTCPPS